MREKSSRLRNVAGFRERDLNRGSLGSLLGRCVFLAAVQNPNVIPRKHGARLTGIVHTGRKVLFPCQLTRLRRQNVYTVSGIVVTQSGHLEGEVLPVHHGSIHLVHPRKVRSLPLHLARLKIDGDSFGRFAPLGTTANEADHYVFGRQVSRVT